MNPTRRSALVAVLAAAWVFVGSAPAAEAHIQMSPSVVAPLDAVKFTMIVPGESTARTTRVELQLPPDVLPFAWQDPPGWKRKIVAGAPGSLGNVIWTGRLAPDGFAEFSFLAGTPEQPGELSWKAIQTYSDGTEVRWIGPPDSEEPAAVTVVDADAPRQNAGGENAEGGESGGGTETTEGATETTEGGTETSEGESETTAPPADEAMDAMSQPASGDDGSDLFARLLGLAAIMTALAAVAFALGRRSGGGAKP
jgi:uncharacterized protein YcnI